ncbi:mandelate racemase/muconate lactonizing enzyme family protein [Tunicatimonas pelagia]|uniref:mandelate racemase/muconate lactonizing enzyme family protein n=1 Tax=Tunicatimonas pelagia TaxID=931531 RepID=UPI002666F0CA|nr:mandelate racemase/muconate lactonizing enzyme family protein [Tunicatimonas pelagia]WKN44999.1 mandelate racemase/muconate lactonizing enzyme family protein [Tunicatimonas pelagia]
MNITRITPYVVQQSLDQPFYFSQWQYDTRTICLVKIETDTGLCGWGEGYGPAAVIRAGIDFFSPFLLGMDALAHENVWQTMYRRSLDYARRGVLVAAISAIDIALWDIKGKALNLPVSTLLGGRKREAVTPYATGMYFTEGKGLTQRLADEAQGYAEQGFQAMKMKVGLNLKDDLANMKAVRQAIGDEIDLMIDANHAYSLREATQLAQAVEPLNIGWFEEPVSPEEYDNYRQLRSKTTIPIAGGECEYLRYGFQQLFQQQSVDIAQPDICATGGLTEAKKVATMAQTYGVAVVPHSWGTGIAVATALHFISNLEITPGRRQPPPAFIELDRTENDLRDKLVSPQFVPTDGELTVPSGSGLGIEVDEDLLQHFSQ